MEKTTEIGESKMPYGVVIDNGARKGRTHITSLGFAGMFAHDLLHGTKITHPWHSKEHSIYTPL
jgi:hypothetical protein